MTPSITFTLDYHGQPFRVVIKDGEPWFVLADLCRILSLYTRGGTTYAIEAMRRLRPGVGSHCTVDTARGRQLVGVVNRLGLVDLAFWAKRPEGPEPFIQSIDEAVAAGCCAPAA